MFMKYSRLIFKRKLSIAGIMLFMLISSVTTSYKISKWIIIKLIHLTRWIIRYIQFAKSGYSYSDIYKLIMNMSGREFEIFLYYLFKKLGYSIKLTQATNDYGRDLIINTEQGEIFIEAKHYSGENYVGREICQKLLGSIQMFGAYKGIVITTGKIHSNAYECAKMVDNLELWDIRDIMKLVVKIDQRQLPYIMTKTLGTNLKVINLNPVNN